MNNTSLHYIIFSVLFACQGVLRFICPVKFLFSISLGSEVDWRSLPAWA